MSTVPLGLNLSTRGVDQVTRSIDSVTKSVDNMQRMQARAVAVGVVMGNVITRLARSSMRFVRSSINTADETAKSARALGLTTRAYQELSFAAERSGVDIRQVDTALRTMNNRLVQGGAVTRRLGLEFGHLRGMSPERQFSEIGRAIAGLDDNAERVALATEMFGRQGPRIAAMAGDFEAMQVEAERLGIIMDEGALQTAEKFQDEMTNMERRFQAFVVNALPSVRMFAAVWVAEIERIANVAMMITDLIADWFGPENQEALIKNMGIALRWLVDNWRDVASNIAEMLTTAFTNSIENLRRLINAARSWIAGRGFDFERVGMTEGANFRGIEGPEFNRLQAIDDFAQRWADSQDRYNTRIGNAMEEYEETLKHGAGAMDRFAGVADEATERTDRSRGLQAAIRGSVDAASAIARAQAGTDRIPQQQLQVQRNIERNTRAMGREVVFAI